MSAIHVPTTHSVRQPVDWRAGLPVLTGNHVRLRELQRSDAPTLHAMLCRREVARFMWPPPPSVEAFERFVERARADRAMGKYVCYTISPRDGEHAVGLFELRSLQPGFFRGELGFMLDPNVWGTGIFSEAAALLLAFAFQVLKTHRIEARAAVTNARGNAALQKIGAKQEGVLRAAFVHDGQYLDQNLWAILSNRAPIAPAGVSARERN